MDLKCCDRCGIQYRPSDHAVGVIRLYVYDSNHTSWPDYNKYDYCRKCTRLIEKRLEDKEKNGKLDE